MSQRAIEAAPACTSGPSDIRTVASGSAPAGVLQETPSWRQRVFQQSERAWSMTSIQTWQQAVLVPVHSLRRDSAKNKTMQSREAGGRSQPVRRSFPEN